MKQRIVAAWKVLRGEWTAVPRDTSLASGLYVFNTTHTGTSGANVTWDFKRTG